MRWEGRVGVKRNGWYKDEEVGGRGMGWDKIFLKAVWGGGKIKWGRGGKKVQGRGIPCG